MGTFRLLCEIAVEVEMLGFLVSQAADMSNPSVTLLSVKPPPEEHPCIC